MTERLMVGKKQTFISAALVILSLVNVPFLMLFWYFFGVVGTLGGYIFALIPTIIFAGSVIYAKAWAYVDSA